jgi:hypothetical protein
VLCRRPARSAWLLALCSVLCAAAAGQDARYDAAVDALVRRAAERADNRALARRVEKASAQIARDPAAAARLLQERLAARRVRVLRVPGLFYRARPQTGADLAALAGWLGDAPLVPTGEADSVERNAALVAGAVRAATQDGVRAVLVSASKGGAEVRAALESDPDLGAHVPLWIDLVGLLEGTPLTDPGVASEASIARWLPEDTARSMSRAVRSAAAAPERFPAQTRAVHVAAFPRAAEISPQARAGFELLRPLGPNDGYLLLEDVLRAPGRVLVVRGADHYLVSEDIAPRVAALLLVLLDELGGAGAP